MKNQKIKNNNDAGEDELEALDEEKLKKENSVNLLLLEIKYKDLVFILEKLIVKRFFQSPWIAIKNGELYSIQEIQNFIRVFILPNFAPKYVNLPPIFISQAKRILNVLKEMKKRYRQKINDSMILLNLVDEEKNLFFHLSHPQGKMTLVSDINYFEEAKDWEMPFRKHGNMYQLQEDPDDLLDTYIQLPIEELRKSAISANSFKDYNHIFKTDGESFIIRVGSAFSEEYVTAKYPSYIGNNHAETWVYHNFKSFLWTCKNPVTIYFTHDSDVLMVEKTENCTFAGLFLKDR